jgi:predicted dehydrogenase|tara:strand:- start:35 stop:982 length:948 start_codon:yes stop_codon:yes gene_type:complete
VKPLRVAVIGAGVMGRFHANVYATLSQTTLIAIVDPDPSRRHEAQKVYGCTVYETLTELLECDPPDAVSVASPTITHHELTRTLLSAGIHVLVEKPAATSVVQAKELVELSRREELVLQVGHITRFYKAVDILNAQIKSPYLVEARRLTPYARIQDVGVILDLMIHDIDIVLGIVESPIKEITVAGHFLNSVKYEDLAAAQIRFENGCIARFLASRIAPDAERTLVVAEEHQTLHLDFAKEPHTEVATFRPLANGEENHVQVDRRVVVEDNPLRRELEHFLARIEQSADPIGTLEDDLRSLELATSLIVKLQQQP